MVTVIICYVSVSIAMTRNNNIFEDKT